MSNQALAFRNNAQARWNGAQVVGRGRNWIKHAHPTEPNRYMLDVCIGPIHTAAQTEIDTAWEVDSGVWQWKMVKADFEARVKSSFNGAPLAEYREGAEWVTLQPRQLDWHNDRGDVQVAGSVQAVTATVNDDALRWTNAYGAGRHFEYQAQTARLAKKIILDSYTSLPAPSSQILTGGNPVLRAQFQFAWSAGLSVYVDNVLWTGGGGSPTITTANAIEFRQANGTVLFAFQKPHTSQTDGDEAPGVLLRVSRSGSNILVETRTPQAWLATANYPIVIDPTIDKTVAASANDADEDDAGTVVLTRFPCLTIDTTTEWFGARWDISDAPIPGGATITACTVTGYFASTANDEPNHPMYFEETASPAAFTTGANDISGRARTTASVTWSSADLGAPGDFTSPSLVTPLQEVVDSQGQLSAVVWLVNGSANGARDFAVQTYDGSTTLAARLHVEYTAGGAITIEQEGFRFRSDDGNESAATWMASQDANIGLSRLSPLRLRMLLNASGDPASSAFQLEWRRLAKTILSDAFTDNSFNTSIWSKNYFYTPNEDQSVTVLETGGFLEVTPLSSVTSVHFNGALSVQQYDLTNHNMVIKGDQVVNAAEGASCTFLYVSPNPSVETYMGFAYEDSGIYFRYVVAGTPSSVVITYNSTDHAWMRLRHDPSDDTIKWETSSNGSTWTLRRSASRPFAITNLYVQSLGAGTYLSVASPGSAKATNFSLSLNATDWAAVA